MAGSRYIGSGKLMDWLLTAGMQKGTYEHLCPVVFRHTVTPMGHDGSTWDETDEYHYDKWGVLRFSASDGHWACRRDNSPRTYSLLDSKRRLVRMTRWAGTGSREFDHRDVIERLTVAYTERDGALCAECVRETFQTDECVEMLRKGEQPEPFETSRLTADGMKVSFGGNTIDLLEETGRIELMEGVVSKIPLRIWLHRGDETKQERMEQLEDEMDFTSWYNPNDHLRIAVRENDTHRFEVVRAPAEIRERFWMLSENDDPDEEKDWDEDEDEDWDEDEEADEGLLCFQEEPAECSSPEGLAQAVRDGRDFCGVFQYDWRNAANKPDCDLYYGSPGAALLIRRKGD